MQSERSIPTRTASEWGDASGIAYTAQGPEVTGADAFFDRTGAGARYEVRGELATGGMGRILEAWDRHHERIVAVKVLLRPDPRALRRFAFEARVTSRLEHPAIVALHDVGRLATGEPFYAMKLVRGQSLRQAVDEAPTLKERLALLPHLIAVAEALAYAHEQRIIHRDLKPSNVLVGRFGETVIVDWGLAKDLSVDAPDGDEENDPRAYPRREDEANEGGLTRSGSALGTPGYMPPEQARGEAVDERADVYALGALVYYLLSGRPPYAEASPRDVISAPPTALASIAPDAPPDLVTISTKAMARDPGARYPSARGLADDLRRFATGKLVSVHTYGLGALIRRWSFRHRAALLVAASLLTALAVVAGLGVRRIVGERDRADTASVVASREKVRAIAERNAAERLVAFLVSDLRDRLRDVGRLDVLAGVGKEVSAYYDSTAQDHPDTELAALEQRAAAIETLADVEAAKHDTEPARALYESALEIRRQVTRGRDDAPARAAEAELLVRMARFERTQGSFDAACALGERASQASDAILAEGALPRPRALALGVAAHTALAAFLQHKGDSDGAQASDALAVEAGLAFAKEEADSIESLRVLGSAYYGAGQIELARGELDAPALAKSVGVREKILLSPAATPSDRLALSESYERQSFGQRDSGHFREALDAALHARDLRAALVAEDPENREWLRSLGQAYDTLCSTQETAHRTSEAIASCKKGIAMVERVVAQSPDAPEPADTLLLLYQRLGWVCIEHGLYAEAEESFRPSLRIAERFAKQGTLGISRLADAHGFLAEVAQARKQPEVARAELRQVVSILEPIETQAPGYEVQRTLVLARIMLARLEAGEDPARARELRVAALRLFATTKGDQSDEETLFHIAQACVSLAPGADADLQTTLRTTIAILEPIAVPGSDEKPRRAALARCAKLLP
ncbi:MAG TPA: protein kinase [Polyangiaceae bacterium]